MVRGEVRAEVREGISEGVRGVDQRTGGGITKRGREERTHVHMHVCMRIGMCMRGLFRLIGLIASCAWNLGCVGWVGWVGRIGWFPGWNCECVAWVGWAGWAGWVCWVGWFLWLDLWVCCLGWLGWFGWVGSVGARTPEPLTKKRFQEKGGGLIGDSNKANNVTAKECLRTGGLARRTEWMREAQKK